MLFDPFEKQFDLPTTTIKIGNALRRQVEMIGQKDQPLALRIFDLDASDRRWEMLLRIKAGQRTELVADDAGRTVWQGVSTSEAQVRLGSRHKETACLVQAMQSREVEIAAIHDVKRPGLGNDLVENVHIVQLAIADVDEAGNVAAQVEQRMQLDRRFGRTKRSPRKYRQAQVDGGRILRIGQRVARHRTAKAHVVELGGLAAQTGFDVAQTLAIGQLGECHTQKLVETSEVFDLVFSIVSSNTSSESGQRQVRHQFAQIQVCPCSLAALTIGLEIPRMLRAKFKSRPDLTMKYLRSFNQLQLTQCSTLGH